jgi:hypothetical protein
MGVLWLMVREERDGGEAWERVGGRQLLKGVDAAIGIMNISGMA